MEEIIRRIIEAAATGFAGDQVMKRTGLGERAEGILDKIIPPAAASDASTIPQQDRDISVRKGFDPIINEVPADRVLTQEEEQLITPRVKLPDGRVQMPTITMQEPTDPAMVDVTDEARKNEVQDFVRMVGSRTQNLLGEIPEEARANPEVQKGAAALATTEGLAAKGMELPDEPMDLGAPVVGAKDVAMGQFPMSMTEFPRGEAKQESPGFFEQAGSFLTDLFGDEERMTRMALAFNSMRLQPDQGLATVLGKRLETLSTQRDRQKIAGSTGNATMQMLDEYPDIKAAYLSGQIELKDALTYIQKMRRLELDEGAPAAFRALEARAKAAGLTPGTKEYNQFMINGGQRKGLSLRVNKDGSIEMTEGGDLSSFTEAQSNALVFSQRMKASNLILDKVEGVGTDLYNHLVNKVPLAGNYLISEEYQQYDQAKRDFINATLRKESGAAIAASEFANADRQYFPVPGDTPAVIAQKRANRQLAQQLIETTVGQDVNKVVKDMNIKAGLESMYATPATEATKPPITPEQAKAELARRRGQ